MRVVYKYHLSLYTTLDMFPFSKVLTVQMQGDQIVMWAICDLEYGDAAETRRFACINTGDVFKFPIKQYIGTVMSSNYIVWHVFEIYGDD